MPPKGMRWSEACQVLRIGVCNRRKQLPLHAWYWLWLLLPCFPGQIQPWQAAPPLEYSEAECQLLESAPSLSSTQLLLQQWRVHSICASRRRTVRVGTRVVVGRRVVVLGERLGAARCCRAHVDVRHRRAACTRVRRAAHAGRRPADGRMQPLAAQNAAVASGQDYGAVGTSAGPMSHSTRSADRQNECYALLQC